MSSISDAITRIVTWYTYEFDFPEPLGPMIEVK